MFVEMLQSLPTLVACGEHAAHCVSASRSTELVVTVVTHNFLAKGCGSSNKSTADCSSSTQGCAECTREAQKQDSI